MSEDAPEVGSEKWIQQVTEDITQEMAKTCEYTDDGVKHAVMRCLCSAFDVDYSPEEPAPVSHVPVSCSYDAEMWCYIAYTRGTPLRSYLTVRYGTVYVMDGAMYVPVHVTNTDAIRTEPAGTLKTNTIEFDMYTLDEQTCGSGRLSLDRWFKIDKDTAGGLVFTYDKREPLQAGKHVGDMRLDITWHDIPITEVVAVDRFVVGDRINFRVRFNVGTKTAVQHRVNDHRREKLQAEIDRLEKMLEEL